MSRPPTPRPRYSRLDGDGEHWHGGVVERAEFVFAHPADPCSTYRCRREFGDDTDVTFSRHESDPMAPVPWFFHAVLECRPVVPGAIDGLVELRCTNPRSSGLASRTISAS